MLRNMQAFALTDKGRARVENEDNFLSKPSVGLFAVADAPLARSKARKASG